MYNQMIPTMSEDQMMEILPKQMSPKVDQMIEEEVEKRIRERLLKNDSEADVKRKLFQDDDKDESPL